jgi:hypothetical protein
MTRSMGATKVVDRFLLYDPRSTELRKYPKLALPNPRLAQGHLLALRDAPAIWTASTPVGAWPEMPDEICDRNADIWE